MPLTKNNDRLSLVCPNLLSKVTGSRGSVSFTRQRWHYTWMDGWTDWCGKLIDSMRQSLNLMLLGHGVWGHPGPAVLLAHTVDLSACVNANGLQVSRRWRGHVVTILTNTDVNLPKAVLLNLHLHLQTNIGLLIIIGVLMWLVVIFPVIQSYIKEDLVSWVYIKKKKG